MLPWYLNLEEPERKSLCGWTYAQTHRCWGGHIFHRGVAERASSQKEGIKRKRIIVIPWVPIGPSYICPWVHNAPLKPSSKFSSFVYTTILDFFCCPKPKSPYLTHLSYIWVTLPPPPPPAALIKRSQGAPWLPRTYTSTRGPE